MSDTFNAGAAPPPPGVIPLQPDAPYIGGAILIGNGILLPIAVVLLVARTYTRIYLTRSVGLDDWYLFIGMFWALIQSTVTILHTHYGLGHHTWDVPLRLFIPDYLALAYLSIASYMLAILFVKLSVLQFYLRISNAKWYRWTIWIMIGITIAYHIGSLVAHLLVCRPIQKNWYPKTEGSCFDIRVMAFARAVLNALNDIVILLIPVPIFLKLQLPRRQKIALWSVFSTGIFVCVVTIVRLRFYLTLLHSIDPSWDGVNTYLWCVIEVYTGIICACMATLRPLLARVLPSGSRAGSKGRGSAGPNISWAKSAHSGRKSRFGDTGISQASRDWKDNEVHVEETFYITESRTVSKDGIISQQRERSGSDSDEGVELPRMGERKEPLSWA